MTPPANLNFLRLLSLHSLLSQGVSGEGFTSAPCSNPNPTSEYDITGLLFNLVAHALHELEFVRL